MLIVSTRVVRVITLQALLQAAPIWPLWPTGVSRPSLKLSHDGEVDRDSYEFLEHNYKLSYLPGDKRLLYVSYRDSIEKDLNEGVKQLDVALSLAS